MMKKQPPPMVGSESEDSYSSGSGSRRRHGHAHHKIHSFIPSTPPPTSTTHRIAKRRKGIPHRAPMSGLIIDY